VQSTFIQLWGVQLEIGTVATPLEKPDPQQDLAKCQRFYQTYVVMMTAYQGASSGFNYFFPFSTMMRAAPVIAFQGTSYINASGITSNGTYGSGFIPQATATATGLVQFASTFTASADL
jgi:hypothetical protein